MDVHVGSRVRLRRTLLGMTQEDLGEAIGVTFQQVQKYESGANRIGSSRLFDVSRVLDVPLGFFFEEMPSSVAMHSPAQVGDSAEELPSHEPNPMAKGEILELVRAYYKISDPDDRKRLFELTKALAAASEDQS